MSPNPRRRPLLVPFHARLSPRPGFDLGSRQPGSFGEVAEGDGPALGDKLEQDMQRRRCVTGGDEFHRVFLSRIDSGGCDGCGGVAMAKALIAHTDRPEVRQLASTMVTVQIREVA